MGFLQHKQINQHRRKESMSKNKRVTVQIIQAGVKSSYTCQSFRHPVISSYHSYHVLQLLVLLIFTSIPLPKVYSRLPGVYEYSGATVGCMIVCLVACILGVQMNMGVISSHAGLVTASNLQPFPRHRSLGGSSRVTHTFSLFVPSATLLSTYYPATRNRRVRPVS